VYNVFYTFLRQLINDKIKTSSMDYNFFTSDIILLNLQTILELLKISKNRNENPYDKPFTAEKELISEDAYTIQNAIFDVENVILIVKIIRSYVNHIVRDESANEENLFKTNVEISNMMRIRKDKRKKGEFDHLTQYNYLYFELIMMNNYDDVYPQWQKFYFNYMNNDSSETMDYEVSNLLFFTKFQIFFLYLYYVFDYIRTKENNTNIHLNNNSINNSVFFLEKTIIKDVHYFFEEMEEEFADYYNIALIFYKLDYSLNLLQSPVMNNLNYSVNKNIANKKEFNIDISVLSQFAIRLNKSNLLRSPYYKKVINNLNINFNSLLISLLFQDQYTSEALALSKSILTLINEYEDLLTQLSLLLEMRLINIAYQFVNNCFVCLVCYSEDLSNESNSKGKALLETIINSEEFNKMKELYFHFFDFLINNSQVSILFTLPYNFIERYLVKEFFIRNKQYEEFLLLYFLKLKKVKEAENCFMNFQKNSAYSNESKTLYGNLIETLKFLYGDDKAFMELDLDKDASVLMNQFATSNPEYEKLSYGINIEIEREIYKNLKGYVDIKNVTGVVEGIFVFLYIK
jgi:hypothetical protein